MTRTTPRRRTILHLSHIRFTDALTFISSPQPSALSHQLGHSALLKADGSLEASDNPAAAWVERRYLHEHAIPSQQAEEVAPHLTRCMRQHLMSAVELDPKQCARQELPHDARHFKRLRVAHDLITTEDTEESNTSLVKRTASVTIAPRPHVVPPTPTAQPDPQPRRPRSARNAPRGCRLASRPSNRPTAP